MRRQLETTQAPGGGKTEDDGDVEDNEGSKHGGKGAEEDEDNES